MMVETKTRRAESDCMSTSHVHNQHKTEVLEAMLRAQHNRQKYYYIPKNTSTFCSTLIPVKIAIYIKFKLAK